MTVPEFVIERTLDASPEVVLRAWTQEPILSRWFGPKGFALRTLAFDLRPGGEYRYALTPPGGAEMFAKWTYHFISASRLVFTASFCDAEGQPARHPLVAEWPMETLSTLNVRAKDGRTVLVLRGYPLDATEAEKKAFAGMLDEMGKGWAAMLEKLAHELAR